MTSKATQEPNLIGEIFRIYQRPVFKAQYEGTAKIVRVYTRYENDFDADVQFADETETVYRRVNLDDREDA